LQEAQANDAKEQMAPFTDFLGPMLGIRVKEAFEEKP
jgi:hypothetical protein